MNKKGYINSFVFIGLSLCIMLSSCEEKQKQDCSVVSCTEEIKPIYITIKDKEGRPVNLDDYYTFIDSRNRFQAFQITYENRPGQYPIVTDEQYDQLSFESEVMIFVGVKDGVNVVEHQVELAKDCCHVKLISGETEIVID